ncbi:MAG: hypothetical protein AABX61_00910, partial [Nanoarchaeota archaeon]
MLNINKKIFIVFILLLIIKFSSADQCPNYADSADEFRAITIQSVFSFLGGNSALNNNEVSALYNFYSENKKEWDGSICSPEVICILEKYKSGNKNIDCGYGSGDGGGINSLCSSNLECKDSNDCTEDICNNPGTLSAQCKHIPSLENAACTGGVCNANGQCIAP